MSSDLNELNWEQFIKNVEICLGAFYDYAVLHTNPIVQMLATSDHDEVEQFRELVNEAIEKLRPDTPLPATARSTRSWTILKMRYLEQQDTARILHKMALSKRQFYRENTKAVEAVALILWEQVAAVKPLPNLSRQSTALQTEIHRVTGQGGFIQIDVLALISGVVSSVGAFANQRNVGFSIEITPEQEALVYSDRVLLRQLLLVLLSHLISQVSTLAQVRVTWGTHHKRHIVFHVVPPLPDLALPADLTTLLETLGVEFFQTPTTIQLSFRSEQPTVLIVDDNPDVVELFRQYLADQTWQVVAVGTGAQALQTARDQKPDVIILDLMLPGQDGLEILQALKSHPATTAIPVLVCSVLNMAELALALGAEIYLHKPPSRAELIEQLEKWRE